MSQAYKCDRCGKLYEAKERTLESKNYSVLKPHIINYEISNPGTYLCHVADLCPECQSKLELWMSLFKKSEAVKDCDNCKYEEYAYNTEPCFSCSSNMNHEAWKPKEDQNGQS